MRFRHLCLVAAAAAVLSVSVPAFATDLVLTGDAYVNSTRSSTNYGSASSLYVGNGSTAYLQFGLNSLPSGTTSAQVSKAVLLVYANRVNTSNTVTVNSCTTAWTEAAVTFNNAPTCSGIGVSFAPAASGGYSVIDITALVQGWVAGTVTNYGISLTTSNADVLFDSKENDQTAHPARIDVTLVNQGPAGTNGTNGANGTNGTNGSAGPSGPSGPQGPTGPAGSVASVSTSTATTATGSASVNTNTGALAITFPTSSVQTFYSTFLSASPSSSTIHYAPLNASLNYNGTTVTGFNASTSSSPLGGSVTYAQNYCTATDLVVTGNVFAASGTGTTTLTVTLYDEGVATPLTCTLANFTTSQNGLTKHCQDRGHTYAVSYADALTLGVTETNSGNDYTPRFQYNVFVRCQ